MKSTYRVAGIAAALALGALSQAQFGMNNNQPAFAEGTWRISFGGHHLDLDGDNVTQLNGNIWFFATENLEVGGGVQWYDFDGTNLSAYQVGLNYVVSQPGASTPFYVGVRLQGIENGISESGIAGAVGAHFFGSETFSFSPELTFGELDGESYWTLGAFFNWWVQGN